MLAVSVMNKVAEQAVNRRLRKIEDEVWKTIPYADKHYEVSNYGRIKSFCYDKENGKIVKPGSIKGFQNVSFRSNGQKKTFLVHKITAECFVDKEQGNEDTVIHLDWNKQNNHFSNLKWVTREHSYKRMMERLRQINKNSTKKIIRNSKLKKEDVAMVKAMLGKGVRQNVIAKLFCISEMQVTRIKRGENWAEIKPLEKI